MQTMSRYVVIFVVTGYAVAALAFGVFVRIQQPFSTLTDLTNEYQLGVILGIALPAFVIPGIVALIGWALARFRLERAAAPLISWFVLLAVYCAFMGYGAIYGKQKRVAAEMQNQLEAGQENALLQLRAELPKKIDDLTTMREVYAGSGTVLYKLQIDRSEIQFATRSDEMKKSITRAACKEPSYAKSLRYGAKYQYYYEDKNGRAVGTIVIEKGDCP
jgi:hypothetical protein